MTSSRIATVETVALDGGRSLCLRRWAGSEPGTLVLLHGMLDSSEGWRAVCERLACTRLAVDLPGFGYSDAPTVGSIAGYAADVKHALDALGVDEFTVAGHSLGGAVATALAELVPERVSGLVLLAPAGFGHIRLAEVASLPGVRRLVQATLPLALTSKAAVTAAYVAMVTNGALPEPEVVSRLTGRGARLVAGAREATRAVVDAGRSPKAFHRRRVRYGGPVYAVWGDRDRLVPPSHRHGVRAAFPRAQIELWAGMGHHPLAERFDDLIALISRAMRAGDSGGALELFRAA
jgi:pimeloyl-ACP methyl ester carboxylesterase